MKRILIAALMLSATPAFSMEPSAVWPYDILPTAKYLSIQGSPKSVRLLQAHSDGHVIETRQEFFRDGRLKESSANSGAMSILVKLSRDGKVKEIIQGSENAGGSRNADTFKPKKYDHDGRLSIISTEGEKSDGVIRQSTSVGVRTITYSARVVTQDQYYKFGEEIKFMNRERNEYGDSGELVAICWGGEVGELCDRSKPIREYDKNGVVRFLTGSFQTLYVYAEGRLESEIRRDLSGSTSATVTRYMQYQVDSCGNWTARKIYNEPNLEVPAFVETRQISYFTNCE